MSWIGKASDRRVCLRPKEPDDERTKRCIRRYKKPPPPPPPPESVPGLYPTNNNASKWIVVSSPDTDFPYLSSPYYPGISTGYTTPGSRTFQTAFDLSGYDLSTVILRMIVEWGSSRSISLNGTPIFTSSGGGGYQYYVVKSAGQSVLTGEGTVYNTYLSGDATDPKAVGFLSGINTLSITQGSPTNVVELRVDAVPLLSPPAPPPPPPLPTHNTPIAVPGLGGTPVLPVDTIIPNWTVSSPNAVSPYPAKSYGYGGYIKGDGSGGPYSFHRTVDLTGFDVLTTVLRMDIYQGVLQILLNGTEVVPASSQQFFVIRSWGANSVRSGVGPLLFNTPLNLIDEYSVGFIQGINTITVVRNGNVEVGDFRALASPI